MWQKRLNSFRFAWAGLRELFAATPNARIHAVAGLAAVAAGFFFKISSCEWLAVIGCIALVVAVEAINTAIETIVDLISPGHHPLAGKAKDLAAGAVLWAAMGAVVVGLVVFLPKVAAYFF